MTRTSHGVEISKRGGGGSNGLGSNVVGISAWRSYDLRV